MAETVKILSPEKKVFLANELAECPMADQMDKEMIEMVKEDYPDYTVVAYINTTASLKTICDVCVTSSSAVRIIKNIPNNNILFIPDCNLGDWVAKQVPEKNIKLLHGGCPTHVRISKDCVCHNMKVTTLGDVYNCVKGCGGEEIVLEDDVIKSAGKCLDAMIVYGQ